MFFRLFVLALILGVAWQVGWRLWRIRQKREALEQTHANAPKQGKMLRCAQCGVHFPEQEAVRMDDKVFCCTQHQILFQKKSDSDSSH